MKNLGKLILLIPIFLCLGNFGQTVNFAQENNSKPTTRELEDIKVENVSKMLNPKEREKIVRLIINSYIRTARQKQSDYISSRTPIYLLLKTNYPNIKEKEEERGISVSNIVKYLNSNPENREIINSVLIEQKEQKCS